MKLRNVSFVMKHRISDACKPFAADEFDQRLPSIAQTQCHANRADSFDRLVQHIRWFFGPKMSGMFAVHAAGSLEAVSENDSTRYVESVGSRINL